MKKTIELTDEEIEIIQKHRGIKDKFNNLCNEYRELTYDLDRVLKEINEIIQDNENYEKSFYYGHNEDFFQKLLNIFEI